MSSELFDILPFRFLDPDGRALLASRVTEQVYAPGQSITRRGDDQDRRIFLLLEGRVEALTSKGRRQRYIEPGHYFGERAALFDIPRVYDARASTVVRVATLPAPVLLQLLREQPAFAHALGTLLREKHGILLPFERFLTELRHSAAKGHVIITRLLHRYRRLNPALHPLAQDRNRIDFGALSYAMARLPENIGDTLSLLLTENMPYLYSQPKSAFTLIPTAARRRTVYEMMPGKSMVVMRDRLSDLVDLVTCLCIYAVEARKIRLRIRSPLLLARLIANDPQVMAELPFSADERAQLQKLWPDLRQSLIRIANHHEDFAITVVHSVDNFNSDHEQVWTVQIAEATQGLTGLDPRELPESYEVHIISSNTHSVGNCLSSWLQDKSDDILAWGATELPDIHDLPWDHPMDRLVALARHYVQAHPEAAAEREATEKADGVLNLTGTALTGIGVQFFDLSRLGEGPIDRELPTGNTQREGLIINIDYAFGQQAETILGNLIALFGHRIRSINVLGKAGGLEGLRGDVMVSTRFVEQEADRLHVVPNQVNIERLRTRITGRQLHVGPILTVVGTVMQNPMMLHYYQRIWGCVGLEMEGSYYARQLNISLQQGLLRPDVQARFLYYISDLPLDSANNLSGSMRLMEGIPPLYAVTREVLTSILEAKEAGHSVMVRASVRPG
ncbi:MAG: cyclic nucleotide-binding domain-containing protein [Rhodobacterales bacterium]|nr:cyclic nucleotide-binding domain-containing protein [Rhodobacterales bacterium]